MKIVIFYKSILGSTKIYAQLLSQKLPADIYTFSAIHKTVLDKYDTIIVASGVYASKMPITGFLKQNWKLIQSKKVVVLVVGLSPADNSYSRQAYGKIPSYIRTHIKIFKVPGRIFNYAPLGDITYDNLKNMIKYIRN
jgi:menaquinone-dependent protoporphyrinogen IX oxidase